MSNFTYKDINIVYEDNHIIVVVKPINILSQSDITEDTDLLTYIKEYIKVTAGKEGEAFVGLVHRLDRPTGGVMVFAKTSKAAMRLAESMKIGLFEKKYLAIIQGKPKNLKDRLEHYLLKNPLKNIVEIAPSLSIDAKRAELEYKVLDTKNDLSLVEINLITGRSHQARVQMASLGTPIWGDGKYGHNVSISKGLALWAFELKIEHPTSKKIMTFRVFPDKDKMPWSNFNLFKFLDLTASNFLNSQ